MTDLSISDHCRNVQFAATIPAWLLEHTGMIPKDCGPGKKRERERERLKKNVAVATSKELAAAAVLASGTPPCKERA